MKGIASYETPSRRMLAECGWLFKAKIPSISPRLAFAAAERRLTIADEIECSQQIDAACRAIRTYYNRHQRTETAVPSVVGK